MCTSTHTLNSLPLLPPPPPMAVEAPRFATAVASNPESVLTSNATASRKRSRGENPQHMSDPLVELRSGTTSTSGRPPVLQSLLLHQNAEIDALVRLQMEKLRSGVEEARKRQCRGIVAAVEQHVSRIMEEKQLEIDALTRRNAELEEKVKQVAAEGQIWFQVARNSEALVSGLRSSLEQALLHGSACGITAGKEGFGESGDDAQSCCYDGEERSADAPAGRACRMCGEMEACVLVLPCRHVCVCEPCAARVDKCPVCGCTKNRCLRIFLS